MNNLLQNEFVWWPESVSVMTWTSNSTGDLYLLCGMSVQILTDLSP